MIYALAVFSMGVILFILSYLIQHRYEEMTVQNKISVTKEYTMKLVVPEIITTVSLVHNQSEIDSVDAYKRKLTKWYIIGFNGYYVINRINGEMTSYKSLDSTPKKYRRKFESLVKEEK